MAWANGDGGDGGGGGVSRVSRSRSGMVHDPCPARRTRLTPAEVARRNEDICQRRDLGRQLYREIARAHGLTAARVRQIVRRYC